jgi:hypothetical protein
VEVAMIVIIRIVIMVIIVTQIVMEIIVLVMKERKEEVINLVPVMIINTYDDDVIR